MAKKFQSIGGTGRKVAPGAQSKSFPGTRSWNGSTGNVQASKAKVCEAPKGKK